MRYDVVRRVIRGDVIPEHVPIRILDLEAVLFHQRHDIVIELDEALAQDVLQLGFPDLELAQFIEIDLVDGATGSDEPYMHDQKLRETATKGKTPGWYH